MKAAFMVPFQHGPTTMIADGTDRITLFSRLGGDYPLEHETCLVVVETDEATVAEMEANPEYIRVEVESETEWPAYDKQDEPIEDPLYPEEARS